MSDSKFSQYLKLVVSMADEKLGYALELDLTSLVDSLGGN